MGGRRTQEDLYLKVRAHRCDCRNGCRMPGASGLSDRAVCAVRRRAQGLVHSVTPVVSGIQHDAPAGARWRSLKPKSTCHRRRGPGSGCSEDERWLAIVLLVPTLVLLGMFIAYPFVRGILLSVTNARVGVPGDFVGLANLQ